MNDKCFTREQSFALIFMAACGNAAYNFIWTIYLCGRSSWVAIIIGILLTIPLSIWILYLGEKYPGCTIFDITEMSFGKFITGILVFLYSLLTFAIAVTAVNMFIGEIRTYFLPTTPPWILTLFIILIALLFVYSGNTVMGRVIEILTIWAIVNYFSGFFFSFFQEFHVSYIIPIFDTSFLQFSEGILFSLGSASELLLFEFVIVGMIPNPLKHYKWITRGIILWSCILSFAAFIMIGIKGHEQVQNISQVGVEVARTIQIGDFIRGLETFIVITYQVVAISKVATCLYSICESINRLFNNQDNKFVLILVALLLVIISVWQGSYNKAFFFSVFCSFYIILPFTVCILIISTIAHLIQKKRAEKNEKL